METLKKVLLITFKIIFTLFLLLFVLILWLWIVTPVHDSKDRTAALKLKKNSSELLLHLERYKYNTGVYPSEEQGLFALIEEPTVGIVPENYKPVVKRKTVIKDPWGTFYVLKYNKEREPEIWTLGKDKQEGGTGKAKDFNIADHESYPKAFRDD
ncbi:MAG: type II secretion system protein GspG [Spirochaetota bacterium]